MTANNFLEFKWFVPMNRRGTVAGTTPQARKTNAPTKSTYVKVAGVGQSTDANLITTTTYSIHLGANFTTDYNLKPNYRYTYNVTLYTDPSQTDSRVETIVI